jgi:hypothetical protein
LTKLLAEQVGRLDNGLIQLAVMLNQLALKRHAYPELVMLAAAVEQLENDIDNAILWRSDVR